MGLTLKEMQAIDAEQEAEEKKLPSPSQAPMGGLSSLPYATYATDVLKGAGKEAVDLLPETVNAVSGIFGGPQVPVPFKENSAESMSSSAGRLGLDMLLPFGVGRIAKGLQLIPKVSRVAGALANAFETSPLLSSIAGGATFADLKSEEGNRLADTMTGALGGAVVGSFAKTLKSLTDPRNTLKSIQATALANKELAKKKYKELFSIAGDNLIYDEDEVKGAVGRVPLKVWKIAPGKAEELYKEFYRDPTFENAHKLQSELGRVITDTTFKGTAGYDQQQRLRGAADAVKTDISNYFKANVGNPILNKVGEEYNNATNLYRDKVIPYKGIDVETNPTKANALLEKYIKKIKKVGKPPSESLLRDQRAIEQDLTTQRRTVYGGLPMAAYAAGGPLAVSGVGGLLTLRHLFRNATEGNFPESVRERLNKTMTPISKGVSKYVAPLLTDIVAHQGGFSYKNGNDNEE